MTELKGDDIKKFLSDDNYYIIYFGNVYKIRDRDITYMGNIEQLVDKKDATKIQIGDQVKCINAKNYELVHYGNIYTVKNVNKDGNIQLVGVDSRDDYWYDTDDFVPIWPEEVRKGETIIKPKYGAENARFGDILCGSDDKLRGIVMSVGADTFDVLWMKHDYLIELVEYDVLYNIVCVGNIEDYRDLMKKSQNNEICIE